MRASFAVQIQSLRSWERKWAQAVIRQVLDAITDRTLAGKLILDCLNRTEKAMTQAHAFKAAELCLKAQAAATEEATT